MRTAILTLLVLIALAGTPMTYGFIEDSANMLEMIMSTTQSNDPSAGGALWIGIPLIGVFILTGSIWFFGLPLAATATAGCLGGWALRQRRQTIPKRAIWLCTTIAAASAIILVTGFIQTDLFHTNRPEMKPATPANILAVLAGINAALAALLGTGITRCLSIKASQGKP